MMAPDGKSKDRCDSSGKNYKCVTKVLSKFLRYFTQTFFFCPPNISKLKNDRKAARRSILTLKMLEQTQALHLCLNKTETIHYQMSLQTEAVTVGLMKETKRHF